MALLPDLGNAPSADGIWQGLALAEGLAAPDLAVSPDAPATIVVQHGQIQWVGPDASLPAVWQHLPRRPGAGRLATPGLVDCHTHLVYGGQRANEFAMRLAGATYEEVAKAGGGIVSSVKATRAATEDELFAQAAPRLQAVRELRMSRPATACRHVDMEKIGKSGAHCMDRVNECSGILNRT